MPEEGRTRLTQLETVRTHGFLRVLQPAMQRMLRRQLWNRLQGIKAFLEG